MTNALTARASASRRSRRFKVRGAEETPELALGEPSGDHGVIGRLALTFAPVAAAAPEVHTIPPLGSPEQVDPMLKAGAEGPTVSLPDKAAMRELARRCR